MNLGNETESTSTINGKMKLNKKGGLVYRHGSDH